MHSGFFNFLVLEDLVNYNKKQRKKEETSMRKITVALAGLGSRG